MFCFAMNYSPTGIVPCPATPTTFGHIRTANGQGQQRRRITSIQPPTGLHEWLRTFQVSSKGFIILNGLMSSYCFFSLTRQSSLFFFIFLTVIQSSICFLFVFFSFFNVGLTAMMKLWIRSYTLPTIFSNFWFLMKRRTCQG